MKKIFILIFAVLFSLALVSATFDNYKTYDSDKKEVTIKDELNNDIARVKLDTAQIYYVGIGKSKKVAEFTIDNYYDKYPIALKQLEFYDAYTMKKISKSFTYKYKAVKSSKQIPIYEKVCDTLEKNGTTSCYNEVQGYETEYEYEYKSFNPLNDLPQGKVTIAVFTDVDYNDYVEWIPTLFDVKITEWAFYVATTDIDDFNDDSIDASLWTVVNNGVDTIDEVETKYLRIKTAGVSGSVRNSTISTLASIDIFETYGNNQSLLIHNFSNEMTTTNYNNFLKVMLVNGTHQNDIILFQINGSGVPAWTGETLIKWYISDDGATLGIKAGAGSWHYKAPHQSGNTSLMILVNVNPATNTLWFYADYYRTTYQMQLNCTLNAPTDSSSVDSATVTFNSSYASSNYTGAYTELKNATLYVWNSTGVFNDTEVKNIKGLSNESLFSVSLTEYGVYTWNVLVCANGSFFEYCTFADSNYTLNYGIVENYQVYNETTFETLSQQFLLNLSYNYTYYSLTSSSLNYNGTIYSSTKLTSDTFRTVLDIPSVNAPTNYSFFWVIRLTNASGSSIYFNSTYHNQTVNPIWILPCNDTYSTATLNFTIKDELNYTAINSSFQSTFYYYLSSGTGTTIKNTSFINTNQNSSRYDFCIYPSHETFIVDLDAEYEADSYSPRTRYLRSATLTNATNEIDLYLLHIASYVKFYFTVYQGMDYFTDATVTLNKYFVGEGVYKTISIKETDAYGEFVEYLDLDKEYKAIIIKDGVNYGSIDFISSCEEAPCTIDLQLEEAGVDLWENYYNIFGVNVSYTLNYTDATKLVTFSFIDLTGLAQYFRLEVSQMAYNQSGTVVCNEILYATSGTLICNLTGYNGDFRANAYVSRSPELFIDYIMVLVQTLKDVLGTSGIFVSLLIIVTIALVGAWNPAVAVILTAFSILMMKLLGFIAFSYTSVILIVIVAIILVTKLKT